MSMTPWTEEPPGARLPEATCRGCGAAIRRSAAGTELWEDPDGITVCVKAGLGSIGSGRPADYVYHQPMPAGLRGAPES
jgi:hypothetical protein